MNVMTGFELLLLAITTAYSYRYQSFPGKIVERFVYQKPHTLSVLACFYGKWAWQQFFATSIISQ